MSSKSSNNILSNKVQSAIAIQTDDSQLLSALDALASTAVMFEKSSNSMLDEKYDPRNVRQVLEQDALHAAQDFLSKVESISDHISQLSFAAEELTKQAFQLNKAAQLDDFGCELAAELQVALEDYEEAKEQSENLNALLSQFELSPNDTSILEDSQHIFNDNITESELVSYLDALQKVTLAKDHLSQRLVTNSSDTKSLATIQILERLSRLQEQGFKCVYNWLQDYLKLKFVTTALQRQQQQQDQQQQQQADAEVMAALEQKLQLRGVNRALVTLVHYPHYYVHVMDSIMSVKRMEVTKRFLLDVSHTTNMNLDPVETVQHILATVHRLLLDESEFLSNLPDIASEAAVKINEEDTAMCIPDKVTLLTKSMGGVNRPLHHRMANTFKNMLGGLSDFEEVSDVLRQVLGLYSICGLIRYYSQVFDGLLQKYNSRKDDDIGSEEKTIHTSSPSGASGGAFSITGVQEEAIQAYLNAVKSYASLLNVLYVDNGEKCHIASELIVKVQNVSNTSPGFDDISDEDPMSFNYLCRLVIDPLIASCESMEDIEALSTINLPFLQDRLKEKELLLRESVIAEETRKFLNSCGLGVFLEGKDVSVPEAKQAAQKFIGSLSQSIGSSVSLPQNMKDQIKLNVGDFYSQIYAQYDLGNTKNSGGSSFFHPDQVRMLLTL